MEILNQPQNNQEGAEKSPDVDNDLEYAKTQAQEKIDQLLQNRELTPEQKLVMVDQKLTEIDNRINNWHEEEKDSLKEARDEFSKHKDTPLAQQYGDEWLSKATDEIRHRYSQWRREDRLKKELLITSREELSGVTNNQTTEINPPQEVTEPEAQVAETEQPNKEETPSEQEQKEIPKSEEIKILLRQNQELAEEVRLIAGRIKSDIDNVSPREAWFQPLNKFKDELLYQIRGQIQNILESVDNLHRVSISFENNSPNAENALQENLDQLNLEWRSLQRKLEDSSDFINRLHRRTEDLIGSRLDRDNPIYRIGYQLRQATEELTPNIAQLRR